MHCILIYLFLFVIFINDIDDGVAGKILKFPDDTKIFFIKLGQLTRLTVCEMI